MKRMYLDQNIWLDIQLGRFNVSLESVLEKINSDKIEIIYSPANIEEIANSYCSPNNKKTIRPEEKDSLLDILSRVTQQKTINPYANNNKVVHSFCQNEGPFIILEHPEICFNRVYSFYESNKFAESAQMQSIDKSKQVDQHVKSILGHKNFVEILEKDPSAREMFFEKLIIKLIQWAANNFLIKSGVSLHPWTNAVHRQIDEQH